MRFALALRTVGTSFALGCLLAPGSLSAEAVGFEVDPALAAPPFELLTADHLTDLPIELRPEPGVSSPADALGLLSNGGSHTVQLHWVVREHGELAGYRVTLLAPEGLGSHAAARWWIAAGAGTDVDSGLRSYSAELSLALDGPAAVAAAVEAVDAGGHAQLLGVRRSRIAAQATHGTLRPAESLSTATSRTAIQGARIQPSVRGVRATATSYPEIALLAFARAQTFRIHRFDFDATASPRGPPSLAKA